MILKLPQYKLSSIKKLAIVVPILNKEKTRIIRFETKSFNRQQFSKPLSTIMSKPSIYQIDHWFERPDDAKAYIYRKEQHIYRFNDDILVYLSMKYNLRMEVTGLNLQKLRKIENI